MFYVVTFVVLTAIETLVLKAFRYGALKRCLLCAGAMNVPTVLLLMWLWYLLTKYADLIGWALLTGLPILALIAAFLALLVVKAVVLLAVSRLKRSLLVGPAATIISCVVLYFGFTTYQAHRPAQDLRDAVLRNDTKAVGKFLDKGDDINSLGGNWVETPLTLAVDSRLPEVVKVLLDRGADINKPDKRRDTPLSLAVKVANGEQPDNPKRLQIFELLMARKPDPNIPGSSGSPLGTAVYFGTTAFVERLLAAGASPKADKGAFGGGVMQSVVSSKHPEAVKIAGLLLDAGADIEEGDNVPIQMNTPLTKAIDWNKTDMAVFLVSRGANVNVKTADGSTPLMKAASEGNLAVVRLLIERRAEINAADKHGNTALDHARNAEIRALLEKNGAKPGTKPVKAGNHSVS